MMDFGLERRLASEFIGTAFLAGTVVGSGIMAASLTGDTALTLLANSIATGAILVALITVLGPISGGHFNPAVSLVFAISRGLTWREFMLYTAAQITGGLAGTISVHLMFDHALIAASEKMRSGGAQWFSEFVASFGLIFIILAGLRVARGAVPWLVGLYITAAYWFTASTSFANPAIAIARSITDTFSGIRPADLPGFILAEIAGAAAGLAVSAWLLKGRAAAP